VNGIPRLLVPDMRDALQASAISEGPRVRTAKSFGFEWTHFSRMYQEWEDNFLAYMAPHAPQFFQGKLVLDAGCGSGRHAYYSARFGAEVWAVDLSDAVETARKNTESLPVHVIQADLLDLPFAEDSFDFVYSIGVLHHLPNPEAGFRNILRYLKPGGEIQIYLYWKPEGQPVKRVLLALVNSLRHFTTRLPHRVLYALSYPLAAAAFVGFVWPYRILSRIPGLKSIGERLPMKQYSNYPFQVCVNDQFDRFSAPIENRYTEAEVRQWCDRAGLRDIRVKPNFGWVAGGTKPSMPAGDAQRC